MIHEHSIRVLHLFDRYLNIYADRGNILVLKRRCEARGIGFELHGLDLPETFQASDVDLLYVGGGQDSDQRMIAERMASDEVAQPVRDAVAEGVAVLAVCGGYQLLGRQYLDVSGVMQPGVGVLPLETAAGESRLIGNVTIEVSLPPLPNHPGWSGVVAGFENHAGRTRIDSGATPLGRVLDGCGNDGVSGYEGCVTNRVIGTYLHGPLLPRNPELTDWLIAAALVHRYGSNAPTLAPLNDDLAHRALAVSRERAANEKAAPFANGKLVKRNVTA